MPRELTSDMTLDTFEDETIYTLAGLKADEDTQDLASEPGIWMGWIAEFRSLDLAYRQGVATTDATRMNKNERLDIEVTSFSKDLLYDCSDGRESTRFQGFFPIPPSKFVKVGLNEEVSTVEGWLASGSTDPVLEFHKESLTSRSSDARAALTATQGLKAQRSSYWQQREALAKKLTLARNGLWRTLAARAEEKGLPQSWVNSFFRVEQKAAEKKEEEGAPA